MKLLKDGTKDKIRSFSFQYCDLATMIENVDFLLRIVCVRINKNNDSPINILIIIHWIICVVCYYYAYVLSAIWFILVRYPQTGEFLEACIMFSLVVCSQPSFVTMFHMIVNKKKVQNLVQSCLQLNEQVKPGTSFANNLFAHLKYIKKRAAIVWILIVVNAVFYALVPMAVPGRHLPEDHQVIYGLEPMFESPNFEIAYLIMGVCVYICAFFLASLIALNLVILGYVEAQMIALSKELKSLWGNAEIYCREHAESLQSTCVVRNYYINKNLKQIIFFHIKNINVIREFEDVFRGTKALQFTCLILSIVSELLGGTINTLLQMTCTLVLILMECLAGQKVIDSSIEFERAVYNCKWERFDVYNRKLVLLMLTNAQKTLNISAGGMATLDFTCMLAVLKFSYSVYNTLRLKV